ncbi:Protein phosphatase 2C [Cordyceps militaris CM01]|uniref:Protein phosphatase 2C n=1 Tax=Cordyceps militaris (strain CM01) TaxID=983644 RepID=G3JNT7_CORMM|nr:Protein phosphatase 2C [Cordyceps militaris CM01]EGX89927.1 Protein phosphatase 2C [Cordyceps militaris CM01]
MSEDDDIRRKLSQDAYSVSLDALGVKRADGAQLPSNSPCEDRYNRAQPVPLWEGEETWVGVTIFDGHYGWQTADHLEKELLSWVQAKLNKLQPASRTDASIQDAIEAAFTELDDSIINNYVAYARSKDMTLEQKVPYMEVAMAGSCALLVLYNPNTKTLYTACTGDSRAVLGYQAYDGTWLPVALSEDQTCANDAEAARLREEHPNEEGVLKDGRVLGLAVSRAFGNFRWKSRREEQEEFGRRFLHCGPVGGRERTPTPPYLIARPVVTVARLRDEGPAVLVVASDGIWDQFENYEVVDLVVRWLEAQPESSLAAMRMTLTRTPDTVWWKKTPPPPAEAHCPPGFDFLERWNNFDIRFREERGVVEDLDNVAVHILRNACGGNHQELLRARLAYRPPFSRDVRDDLTVQVLFF